MARPASAPPHMKRSEIPEIASPCSQGAVSNIRAMVQAQEVLQTQNSAISRWHARPRTAHALRTPFTPSQRLLSLQQTELRHQTSLRDWHHKCTSYRHDLQKWKRETQRGSNMEVLFPSFTGK